jgi:hypothetical protein
MMCGHPPVRPTGSWGTSGVEMSLLVDPGAGVLGTAIRMVPLASAPPGLLGLAVVPVSLGPCAAGWDGRIVVFVLFASGFASPDLCRRPPRESFSDQYRGGPVLGFVLTRTATCAG